MNLSPPTPNANTNTSISTATINTRSHHQKQQVCSNCGLFTKWTILIHNVRFRGLLRRLCTSCVLRHHPSSFCPTCFVFYDSNPPHPSKRLCCSSCSSLTHANCASNPTGNTPFLCPPCADQSFKFFDINKAKGSDNTDDGDNNDHLHIDKNLAAVLLCAARIASSSMGKAVIVARAEAERRVREAALARKRARESLEHMLFVESKLKEKARKRDDGNHNNSRHHNKNNAVVSEVSGSGVVVGDREKQKETKEGPADEKDSGQQQRQNVDHGTVNADEKMKDAQHLPKNNLGNKEDIIPK